MKNIIIIVSIFLIVALIAFYYLKEDNKSITDIKNTKKINLKNLENAYFAGGCFWCMEGIFEAQEGVSEAIAGYIGGDQKTANYKDVSGGKTKHREGVKIIYDPKIISFDKLSELFWTQIDPTDPDGQFADKGFQYTTALYYNSEPEKEILEKSKLALELSGKFDREIATKILPFPSFFKAEEYHQDYYKKSSLQYNAYKKGSGRKDFIEDNWEERIEELQESSIGGQQSKGYVDYSENILKNAIQDYIVLFFHASWCPTCKAFEKQVLTETIPDNILILKVDFDKELDLRKKYNIVTQTSFLIVDNKGNLLDRWIGARGIDTILEKVGKLGVGDINIKIYTKEELKAKLTPIQYKITQEGGTEPPFDNKYWDNYKEGIYVDIVDRTPLFSSTDKFESGTGWPSFTKPIDENFIKEKEDYKLLMRRTEVLSDVSHLGHVFEDGPKDEGGLRYCINSAALDFIPKDELEGTEYEKYLVLFEDNKY